MAVGESSRTLVASESRRSVAQEAAIEEGAVPGKSRELSSSTLKF